MEKMHGCLYHLCPVVVHASFAISTVDLSYFECIQIIPILELKQITAIPPPPPPTFPLATQGKQAHLTLVHCFILYSVQQLSRCGQLKVPQGQRWRINMSPQSPLLRQRHPSTSKAEIGRSWVEASLGYTLSQETKTNSNKTSLKELLKISTDRFTWFFSLESKDFNRIGLQGSHFLLKRYFRFELYV